jgi:hypothetical protein
MKTRSQNGNVTPTDRGTGSAATDQMAAPPRLGGAWLARVRRVVFRLGAALAVLALITGVALVIVMTKIGPTVYVVWTGVGLHALDVVAFLAALPLIVYLLRYLQRTDS